MIHAADIATVTRAVPQTTIQCSARWTWLCNDSAAPGFTTIRGMMDVAANYELITDNLLDLTHADFLHEGTLSSEAITISKLETLEAGSTVWANRWCPVSHQAMGWAV